MASSPTRALTFQEKVQRKRRNKAAASGGAATTPEGSQGGSFEVNDQSANATSAASFSESRASEEHLFYPQQVESPLASAANNTRAANDNDVQRNSMNGAVLTNERKEAPTLNRPAVSRRRKKLPKWPPDPDSDEEESSSAVNEQSETPRASEEQTIQTKPSPQAEQSSSVGKAPWIRTSPTSASNNVTFSGNATASKPSWARPAASEETPSEAAAAPVNTQERAPLGPTKKSPWSSVQNVSPNAPALSSSPAHEASQQQPPWAKSSPSERAPSPVAHPYSQQKMPWIRPQRQTPSPAAVNSDENESRQNPPWVRSEQRTPSPLTNAADVDSQQQQKPPWARSQRTPSPVSVNGQSQKPPWVKSPLVQDSPVSDSTTASSPSRRRWVRPPVKERTPSPLPIAGNVYSQQKAPWVRSSANEETSLPATDSDNGSDRQQATLEQNESDQAYATKGASPQRPVESLGQRRARILKRELGQQSGKAISSQTRGGDETAGESVLTGDEEAALKPRSVSRTKKWPPVKTEPFSNGYKQQQQTEGRTEEMESSELPTTTDTHMEELPSPQPSQSASHDPSPPSMSAHAAAVRKGPWLRTSPSSPGNTSSGKNSFTSVPANETAIAEPSRSQKKNTWGRRTPSPVPTDENQNSFSWAHSAATAQFCSPTLKTPTEVASKDKSLKHKSPGHSYKKPPPSPYFGKVNYVPPWVKAREEANADASLTNESDKVDTTGNDSDQLGNTEEPLQDELYAVPSDENVMSPPAQPSGKQSIESPPSPSIQILNEVKTRRVPSSSGSDDGGRETESEEVAEIVVSYGGAVIEKPKSVNVASMASSFASGEKFSSPTKQKPLNGQNVSPAHSRYGGSPEPSDRPLLKQRTSPGDQTPKQPHRLLWTHRDNEGNSNGPDRIQSSEQPYRSDRGKWGQVHSPPPSWLKATQSNKQQSSTKPPMYQRDSSADKVSSPLRKMAPARSPPPSWIKRDVSQGDISSIKSPQWGSKAAHSKESGRTPPPTWVNRDVSQGDMSSIRSPDWSTKQGYAKKSVNEPCPPSWVDDDAGQNELSPIESPPPPSSMQRKVLTVETVLDDDSVDEGIADRNWYRGSQTTEYGYSVEEQKDRVSAKMDTEETSFDEDSVLAEQYENVNRDFDDDPTTKLHPPKSPSKSLVQMAMDSVFALDFDRALSQAKKEESLEEDDDDSVESSVSRGIAKSTPPERELPAEVKALLEKSLNRTSMSDSGVPDDSGAYEADYFSTDMSTSAIDQSGSTWNENDISALSNGSGLPPNDVDESSASSYDKKELSLSSPSRARRALQFSGDDSTAKSEASELPDETLERIRGMKLNDGPRGGSEAGSSSVKFGDLNTDRSAGRSNRNEAPRVSIREKAVDVWSGGRVDRFASSQEEPISSKRTVSFMNFATNESTIDLGNPNDFSIQVSPDSPPQTSLVGTSPALLSDSPPEEFPSRSKTVRFGGPETHRGTRLEFDKEAAPTISSLLRRGKENRSSDEKRIESRRRVRLDFDKEPPPTVSSLRRGTDALTGDERQTESRSRVRLDYDKEHISTVSSLRRVTGDFSGDDKSTPVPPPMEDDSPASAGAKHVLQYYTEDQHKTSRMDRDLEAETNGNRKGHIDWPSEKPPSKLRDKSPPWAKSFDGQDPFSKQDAHDPFFKQDDPFATSRSASSEFASDFGDGFNPFTDTEAHDAFDFEKEEEDNAGEEYFSPYGDAPKAKSSSPPSSRKLTPSRRDRRRHREASVRYDDFVAPQAASYEPSPSNVADDDSFVEYYAQQASYAPSSTESIGRKDGTYLLEI